MSGAHTLTNGQASTLPAAGDAARIEELEAEREQLLEMVTHLQRVAQTGLITSALAHDVANHIQVISGVSYLAAAKDSPNAWKKALERVQAQCVELTETTESFLGFVRRREAACESTFKVSAVVESAYRLVLPLARRHCVELTQSIEEDAQVRGGMRLAIQAVVNLVSNAVRACDGDIRKVSIAASVPRPGACRIQVSDNGPGIPKEMRWRLFRPFSTGQTAAKGTGLGLFIVRRTVRELDGRIRVWCSSEGTTFSIDLPTTS